MKFDLDCKNKTTTVVWELDDVWTIDHTLSEDQAWEVLQLFYGRLDPMYPPDMETLEAVVEVYKHNNK